MLAGLLIAVAASIRFGTRFMGFSHTPPTVAPLAAEIEAHGLVRLARAEIAEFRRRPDPLPEGWDAARPSPLRNADEQTVAAVAAVRRALENMGNPPPSRFEDWGVVAAPRFLGRSHLLLALDRFKVEGPWGVSPHLIPHFALHAQAGALSLVLGGHGPNMGAGGGLFAGNDGVLTALSWLDSGLVPGVWLVLTNWGPEYAPDLAGEPREPTRCEALALALEPCRANGDSPRLRIVEPAAPTAPAAVTAAALAAALNRPAGRVTIGADATGHWLVELDSGFDPNGEAA